MFNDCDHRQDLTTPILLAWNWLRSSRKYLAWSLCGLPDVKKDSEVDDLPVLRGQRSRFAVIWTENAATSDDSVDEECHDGDNDGLYINSIVRHLNRLIFIALMV